MRVCILALLLCFGCAPPLKGTADSAAPVLPVEDADADDADDTDDDDADADDDDEPDTPPEPEPDPLPYDLEVTPAEVNFGVVSVGTSTSQIVDVKNVGTQSLHINGVNVTDRTAFDVTPDFATPITFTPGMERTMRITFEPSETTTYSERVSFFLEEAAEMEESSDITLRGLGQTGDCDICSPIIDVSPRDLTIDALLTCSGTDKVYVRNEGDQPLEVSSVTIINDSLARCGTFSTGSGAMTIAAYGETEITVVYTATSECADIVTLGSEENTMKITSNDPVDPVVSVGLTGYATCVLGF